LVIATPPMFGARRTEQQPRRLRSPFNCIVGANAGGSKGQLNLPSRQLRTVKASFWGSYGFCK
jgi:hypothetical protein